LLYHERLTEWLTGAFTDNTHLTWRWCFYINLPLGGVTLLAILFLFRDPPREEKSTIKEHLRHLDLVGTALFIPAVVSLLLALQWAGTIYPWSDWRIILLLCVFGLVSIIWGIVQYRKGDLATVPPRIIAQRSIYVGLAHITVIGAAAFCVAYFIPIWFQAVGGVHASAIWSKLPLCVSPGCLVRCCIRRHGPYFFRGPFYRYL